MTNEQARERIESWLKDDDVMRVILPEDVEALKVAISALSENKGDLISRNQAQAKLKEICERFNYFYDERYGEGTSGYAFVHAFDDVPPVENKGEWIPVTERLPENNDDVLVYDGSDIFVAWYSGIDWNWCSADNRFDEYTPIIAWQPLPEPYKGESK